MKPEEAKWYMEDHLKDNRYCMNDKTVEAFEDAIAALEKADKYKGHNLRKNPLDLPKEKGFYLVKSGCEEVENTEVRFFNGTKFRFSLTESLDFLWRPIAWKCIEPFEEVDE